VGHAVKRLLLAGGGTGGHLYPAMAVGEAWRARFGDEAELLFVGTAERIEATAVPAAGERLATIEVTGIVGLRGWRRVLGLARMPLALWQALRIVRQFEPDAVLGAGGFASGPTVLAAWLLRKPTAILEQNAMPGVTNRILGKLVRRVFTCFARAESWFAVGKVRRLGNPVRASQTEALASAVRTVREDDTSVRILVMGGSGGARALNEGAPRPSRPSARRREPEFRWFTRRARATIWRRSRRCIAKPMFVRRFFPTSTTWPSGTAGPTSRSAAPAPPR
jgi:UDP-N-acetylglucosamine--N-acetylmuramyl-(pentapeptide) pyrophosphoryl-undecaprenol N-acetylglucosamine transferase